MIAGWQPGNLTAELPDANHAETFNDDVPHVVRVMAVGLASDS
jgi:hypothetical protein